MRHRPRDWGLGTGAGGWGQGGQPEECGRVATTWARPVPGRPRDTGGREQGRRPGRREAEVGGGQAHASRRRGAPGTRGRALGTPGRRRANAGTRGRHPRDARTRTPGRAPRERGDTRAPPPGVGTRGHRPWSRWGSRPGATGGHGHASADRGFSPQTGAYPGHTRRARPVPHQTGTNRPAAGRAQRRATTRPARTRAAGDSRRGPGSRQGARRGPGSGPSGRAGWAGAGQPAGASVRIWSRTASRVSQTSSLPSGTSRSVRSRKATRGAALTRNRARSMPT